MHNLNPSTPAGNRHRLSFGFSGNHDEQAALLSGLIAHGLRVTVFEEHKSTFEDILIEVAENPPAE